MIRIVILLFCFCIQFGLFGQSDSIAFNLLTHLANGTEISIGVYEKGDFKTYGFVIKNKQLETKSNADKLFEIGSITKVFTTLSALRILEKNEIGIHSSINDYLPDHTTLKSSKITFYTLMTHTSGLPKMPRNFMWSVLRSPNKPFLHYTEKRMFSFLKGFDPSDKEEFRYSNLGMGLLGYLSTKIDSQSLQSIMHHELFGPLQMNATSVGITENNYYKVVNSDGGAVEPRHTWLFSEVTKGAGSIYSTVNDMIQFLKFIFSQNEIGNTSAIVSQMEEEYIQISEHEGMGLGWRIYKDKSKIMYHGGITYGYKSLIAFNRELEEGIVVLTNATGLSRKENKLLKQLCFQYLMQK